MRTSLTWGLGSVLAAIVGLCNALHAANTTPVAREDIEWLDVWMPNTNDHALPRVLLIGDSITRAYGSQVESALKGTAYVSRLATSKSLGDPALLQEVALVLQQQAFDVIHFNNGLHGEAYSEAEYAAAFPRLVATLRQYAPHSRLIWASTTEVRKADQLDQSDPFTERVMRRNAIAADYCAKAGVPIDDLFALTRDRPDFHLNDGVHFNDAGIAAQAAQVSAKLKELLAVTRSK